MTFITEWIMQIIVFILIGTIIELLIPNNAMKKYINIVVGLLLLIILAKPILFVFQQFDPNSQLSQLEKSLFQSNETTLQSDYLIETQKKEIQAEQHAYIWNEVKLQMMNAANPNLQEQYDVQIEDVSFVFQDEKLDNFDEVGKIVVTLSDLSKEDEDSIIKPVSIDMNEQNQIQTKNARNNQIKSLLIEHWGVNNGQLQIIWEGGTF